MRKPRRTAPAPPPPRPLWCPGCRTWDLDATSGRCSDCGAPLLARSRADGMAGWLALVARSLRGGTGLAWGSELLASLAGISTAASIAGLTAPLLSQAPAQLLGAALGGAVIGLLLADAAAWCALLAALLTLGALRPPAPAPASTLLLLAFVALWVGAARLASREVSRLGG